MKRIKMICKFDSLQQALENIPDMDVTIHVMPDADVTIHVPPGIHVIGRKDIKKAKLIGVK